MTQLTPLSLPSELEAPTLEPDVLGKVDLLGCTECNPKDQQEAQSILMEEGAKPIKEFYRTVPPGWYDEV